MRRNKDSIKNGKSVERLCVQKGDNSGYSLKGNGSEVFGTDKNSRKKSKLLIRHKVLEKSSFRFSCPIFQVLFFWQILIEFLLLNIFRIV